MVKKIFLIFFALSISYLKGQNNDSQAAVYNVVVGSVFGGIGSLINKKNEQNWLKRLAKGSAQGALGGYVVFESKRMLRNYARTNSVGYVWPSKLLNSAGNSIIQNAAANRNFWEKWTMNIGFNHFEFDLKSDKKFKYRIMPISLVGTIDGFINGKIDLDKSFTHGQFIFTSESIDTDISLAYNLVNNISYPVENQLYLEDKLAHEIIHIYQYESTFSINSFFYQTEKNWSEKSNFYKIYKKYFHSDYGYLLHLGLRGFQDLMGVPLIEQYQEKEASYYGY